MTVVNTDESNGIICEMAPDIPVTGATSIEMAVAVVGEIMAEGIIKKCLPNNYHVKMLRRDSMKKLILITLLMLCYFGTASACNYCDPYYAERVIVYTPCCQGATAIHYPCPPPCGPYPAPYPYAYEHHHYVYPYPSSGYNFQFGYTRGRSHGKGHGRHHRGSKGYSFSIGGFSIGR